MHPRVTKVFERIPRVSWVSMQDDRGVFAARSEIVASLPFGRRLEAGCDFPMLKLMQHLVEDGVSEPRNMSWVVVKCPPGPDRDLPKKATARDSARSRYMSWPPEL